MRLKRSKKTGKAQATGTFTLPAGDCCGSSMIEVTLGQHQIRLLIEGTPKITVFPPHTAFAPKRYGVTRLSTSAF